MTTYTNPVNLEAGHRLVDEIDEQDFADYLHARDLPPRLASDWLTAAQEHHAQTSDDLELAWDWEPGEAQPDLDDTTNWQVCEVTTAMTGYRDENIEWVEALGWFRRQILAPYAARLREQGHTPATCPGIPAQRDAAKPDDIFL